MWRPLRCVDVEDVLAYLGQDLTRLRRELPVSSWQVAGFRRRDRKALRRDPAGVDDLFDLGFHGGHPGNGCFLAHGQVLAQVAKRLPDSFQVALCLLVVHSLLQASHAVPPSASRR